MEQTVYESEESGRKHLSSDKIEYVPIFLFYVGFFCAEAEPESEEEKEKEDADLMEGLETPSGLASGFSSVASGLETPERIDLRKDIKRAGDETPEFTAPKQLYTVIPQKEVKAGGFMGSGQTYDLSGVSKKDVSFFSFFFEGFPQLLLMLLLLLLLLLLFK